jgi:hypothetical protein
MFDLRVMLGLYVFEVTGLLKETQKDVPSGL